VTDDTAPSSKLAALTVDRLVASGLVRADKRESLIGKIAAGSMGALDWKLEIEIASEKAAG
jgi:hypothetical protein